jgi:hypothetical protein
MSTPTGLKPALLATLFVTLTLACLTSQGSPAASAGGNHAPARRTSQQVAIDLLPPIRQPNTHAARLSDTRTVITVSVTPAVAGRRIHLERRTGAQWHRMRVARTDRHGRATFFVPAKRSGRWVSYRATAESFRGLPRKRSARVGSGSWGAPDFIDQFDGDQLDAAWQHRIQFYNPWGGRACSKGDPSAVSVGGGVLRLSSIVDPAATGTCTVTDASGQPLGQYPYRLNANISTQHSADFLYGVAAARMRFPRSLGQHAAFWLQPRGLLSTGPTPWGAEVDVVEWYGSTGKRSVMSSAVYAPAPDGAKREVGGMIPRPNRFLASRSDSWWTRFHVFSVEWTPHEYVFRIGGHEVWRTTAGVSNVPEFLILSMLSSDFELPDVGSDPTPRTAEVDWVAFWQTGRG